jgi:hypothetical protein
MPHGKNLLRLSEDSMIPKPKGKKKKTLKRRLTKTVKKTVLLDKHTPVASQKADKNIPKNIPVKKTVKNNASLVSFHPVPKPGHKPDESISVINRVSQRQREREQYLRILKRFLLEKRAGGKCEIPYCGSVRNLQAAHIIERSQGGKDTSGNIIIACEVCHNHQKYPHGLPLSTDELLRIVFYKNLECGISNFLTGDLIPNGGED